MDTLQLEIEDVVDPVGIRTRTVAILINGRDLRDLVREVELPYRTAQGSPQYAGRYAGLEAGYVLPPSRHFLGEPARQYRFVARDDAKTAVLQCICLEPGCWPLVAKIAVTEDEVVWSDFEQPHRGPDSRAGHWRYDALGPFAFSRPDYEAEILRLSDADV